MELIEKAKLLLNQSDNKEKETFLLYAESRYYINIGNFNKSEELAKKILNEIGVALTPGTDFDKNFGLRTLRLAFSIDNQKVIEAVTKLKKWFEQDWVDIGSKKKGGGFAKCGRSKQKKDAKRKYPKRKFG